MVRRILIALVGLALWLLALVGLLVAFTDTDFATLTPSERAIVLGLLLPGPCIVALVAIIRRFQARDLYEALEGLDLEARRIFVSHGLFEDADGRRHAIWQVTSPVPKDTHAFVVLRRGEPAPDYAASMIEVPSELPPELVLRVADPAAPIVLDRTAMDALAGMRGFMQLRARSTDMRLLLERPVPDLRALRSAVAVVLRLAQGESIDASTAARPLVDRKPIPTSIAGYATLLSFVSFLVLGFIAPDSEGYESYVLARARECPLVTRALGGNVRRKSLGWQPSSQSGRHQTSHLLLVGDRTEGDVTIEAFVPSRGTSWYDYPIYDATLEVGEQRIEVFSCARNARRGMRGVRALAGHVVSGTLPSGTTCTASLTSVEGPQSCRMVLRCDGRTLYGATPETGYSECWSVPFEGRDHVVFRDLPRGGPRSEPWLDYDERTGRLRLGDERGQLSLEVALDP